MIRKSIFPRTFCYIFWKYMVNFEFLNKLVSICFHSVTLKRSSWFALMVFGLSRLILRSSQWSYAVLCSNVCFLFGPKPSFKQQTKWKKWTIECLHESHALESNSKRYWWNHPMLQRGKCWRWQKEMRKRTLLQRTA